TLAAGEKTLPPVIALVDETAFRARAAGDDARLVGRRATWRDALAADGVAIVFSDLAAPDLAAAETALDAALAGGR
ncbi:MAG: hypothetical protein ABI812_04390, partial [Betaproteobacteria bacterium]